MLVQDWAPLAACGTAEPDALFVQGAAQQQAKQICLRCPVVAECLADGRRYVQAGELLHPGECCLEPGESYTTPWVMGVWSPGGLTPASWGFHRVVRAVGAVPPARPRLVCPHDPPCRAP